MKVFCVWILLGILFNIVNAVDNKVVVYSRPQGNTYGYSSYDTTLTFPPEAPGYPTKESTPTILVVNNTKIYVLGSFDLWNQSLVGGIMQYDISTQYWSSVGMGVIGRTDAFMVEGSNLVFFGAITGYQENPSVVARGVIQCNSTGSNCGQYGNGISDYHSFGSIQLVNGNSYTSYQSTNKTWIVRKYNQSTKNWNSVFASYNSFVQIVNLNNILHMVGNFSYGAENGSIATYNASSNTWTVLSSQPVFGSFSRPSIATYDNFIWAFTPAQQLVRWNSTSWEDVPIPFSCGASSSLYGGPNLLILCNGTAYRLDTVANNQSIWSYLYFGYNEVTSLASTVTDVYASGPVEPAGLFMLQRLVGSPIDDFATSLVLNVSQTETVFRGQCAIGSKILTSGEFNAVYTTPVTNYTALWNGKEWKNIVISPRDVLCSTNNNSLFIGFEKKEANQLSFGILNYDQDKFDLYTANITVVNGSLSLIRASKNYLYFVYGNATFAQVLRWKLKSTQANAVSYLFNITAAPQTTINVMDIQTDDNVLFMGGSFSVQYTSGGKTKTSMNFAKFNLDSNSFEYVDSVGTNQSRVYSIALTPNVVFVGGTFQTAGSLRVNNIAGCSWNGTFTDNLSSGIPTSSVVKDLVYDFNEDTLYFLAAENPSCGPPCSTLYSYAVSTKYLDYNLKQGVGGIFLAVPETQSDDDSSSKDNTLTIVLAVVLPTIFVILAVGGLIYFRRYLRKRGYLVIEDGPLFGFSSADYDSIDFSVEPFELKTLLGRGSFGSVWSCVLPNRNGATYAVKQMLISVGDTERINVIENEIATLQRLQHKNIVHFVGYKKVEGSSTVEFFIFMELFEKPSSLKGAIQKMAKKGETFPVKKVKDMLQQIAEGLKYLHDNGIAHRDLKSANVLVRVSGGEVKTLHIADFGLATTAAVASTLTGTPAFMAPEMSEKKYDPFKADIWAFGIVMYEILTLQEPAVPGIRPSLPDSITTDAHYDSIVILFNLCTSADVDQRPAAAELLSLCYRL